MLVCLPSALFFIRFLACLFANRTHVPKNLHDFHLFFMYNCSPSLSPRKEEKQKKKENTAIEKQGDKLLLLLHFETKAFIHPSTSFRYLLSYFKTSLLIQLKNRLQIPSNSSDLLSIPYITFSYAAVSVTSAIHSLSSSPDSFFQVLSISFQYHETKRDNARKLTHCI